VTYSALRVIAFIWKLAGYVALIGSLALIAFAVVASAPTIAALVFPFTTRAGIVTLTRLAFLGGGIVGVWISLLTIALGDFARAIMRIEVNTRR
jgi:hypothetical protein